MSCPSLDGIEWQKSSDGETFSNIDLREPKHFGSSHDPVSPLLVILNVNFEDKLYYRLLAWNKIGETYSNTIYLNVTGSKYYKLIVCYKLLIYHLDLTYFFLSRPSARTFVRDSDVLTLIFVLSKEKQFILILVL